MNVFETYAKIELDTKGLMRNLNETKSKFSTVASGLKNGISKIAKVSAVGLGASATAMGKFVKDSVDAYGEYEQLVGGVETLFKNSAKTIEKYAENAYKTAGMSANKYMSLATSFSASLLQGLEGDTKKASQYTDQAIKDMSDNANKMGTDLEMIQNAYQGFAKGNFMMLDNLKLGYGGTKTEMARLINDTKVLGDVVVEVGKNGNFDEVVTFDKMIEAIHKVQNNLGITGTTAKEAEKTIEGSFNSMKASFENLKVAFAGGGKGVGTALSEFSKSVVTYGKNLIPVVQTIFKNLGNNMGNVLNVLFKDVLPLLSKTLVNLFKTSAKSIVKAGPMILENIKGLFAQLQSNAPEIIGILSGLFDKIASEIPNLMVAIFDYMKNGFDLLMEYAPDYIEKVYQTFLTIFQTAFSYLNENGGEVLTNILSFITNIFDLVGEQAPTLIPKVVSFVSNLIFKAIEFLTNNAPSIVSSIITALTGIITGIVNSLPSLFSQILSAIPQLIQGAVGLLKSAIPQLINSIISIFENLVDKLPSMLEEFFTKLPDIMVGIADAIVNLLPVILEGIGRLIVALVKSAPKLIKLLIRLPIMIINATVQTLKKLGSKLLDVGKESFENLIKGAKVILPIVKDFFVRTFNKILDFFHVKDMIEVGKNLIRGLINGLLSAKKWMEDKLSGIANGIIKKFKSLFGIHSPSRVFAELGKFLAMGLELGWDKTFANVQKRINDGLNFTSNLNGNVENASGINTIRDSIIQLNDENYTRLLEALESTTIVLDNKEVGRAVRRYA